MKKRLSLLLALALLLSLASGLASASADEAPVKFSATFLKNDWHGDPNDMEIMQRLAKEANVEVEWQVYSNATWTEKKNLLINSGDIPDVFYMNAVNNSDIEKYGQQGMFLELGGLIDAYAPRLKAAMESNPTYKALCTSATDGKIYTICRAAERPANRLQGQMYIYKPWLDKLGLAVPTTSEEFYQVLKAFKEQDPNGNGKADEQPYAFSNMEPVYSFGNLFGMFGYTYGGIANSTAAPMSAHYILDGAEVVCVPQTEQFKQAVIYFNRMFKEGLFSAEDYATADSKLENSKVHTEEVTVGCFQSFDYDIMGPADRKADYVRMEPMAGPDGAKVWQLSSSKNNMGGTQFVMTHKAKGKEEAIMRWLDAHFDKQTSIELFLGPVGVTLQRDAGGMLDYVPTPEGKSYSEFRYANCPVHVPCAISEGEWGVDVQVMSEDLDRWDIMQTTLKPFLTQSMIYQYPTAEESKFQLSVGKDLDDYVRTTVARWLTDGGIESEWDGFQSQLTALGVDQYTQIMKDMVARFDEAGK